MPDAKTSGKEPIEIPEPQAVRAELGEALRRTQLLRQLLRVAERAAKERARKGGELVNA